MTLYTDLAATATTLLTTYGQSVTVTRSQQGAFSPATGTYGAGTGVTFTGYGAAFDYDEGKIDGASIIAGDKRFLLEAVTTAPEAGAVITLSDGDMTIISVRTTAPAGVAVVYECQLRL